jgi:hypothetical protein
MGKKVDSDDPMFAVRCEACGAEIGEACSTWEGYPVGCMGRSKLAEKIFGKHKYVNGKYVKI